MDGTIDKVIEGLAERNLLRISKPIGDWYQIYCPWHNNGNERRPSCGVSRVDQFRNGQMYPKGTAHCFACGKVASLEELVGQALANSGISNVESLDWIKSNIPGVELSNTSFEYLLPNTLIKSLNSKFAQSYVKSKTQKDIEYVPESELAKYRYTIPYLYERKLTDEIIDKFDVGVDLEFVPPGRKNKIATVTFPVRDSSGKALFVYRRAVNSKNFYMPSGINKPVYGIYEMPDLCPQIVICESIFNALTCYVYGIPALALFGTGTVSQINALKALGVKEFILGLDPDPSGDSGSRKLKNALKSVAIIRRMYLPEGKDINDLEYSQFWELFNERI